MRLAGHTRTVAEPAAPRAADGPVVSYILVCWTLVDPSGAAFRCELCRVPSGLEVHCTRGGDGTALRAEPVASAADGLELATRWRTTYMSDEGFVEAAPPVRTEAQVQPPPPERASPLRLTTVLESRARRRRGGDLRRRAG